VILLEMLPAAALVAGVMAILLIVWSPRGGKLPDPSTLPDLPMAGPASQKAAHAAINRRKKV
jgi:hypothetical protein